MEHQNPLRQLDRDDRTFPSGGRTLWRPRHRPTSDGFLRAIFAALPPATGSLRRYTD